jgi:carbamoyl-phosphate synthase large subunit
VRKILVSGASGIVGYGILRSLRKSGDDLLLIGTTIYDDSVAEGFCDIFERAPSTSDPKYREWLVGIIKKHKVDLLMPGIEIDMYAWVNYISEIEKAGAKVLLNNLELISICKDKWLFYENLKKAGSPHLIESSLSQDYDELVNRFGSPFILKPKRGYGSKGIVVVESREKFLLHVANLGSILLAQQIVGDEKEEFTTSAFCDGKGGFCCSMTMKRKLSKDGFTDRAEVINVEEINDALTGLCAIYKPMGPTNFQFRLHNGTLKLLEINPRISSSTSIRTAFGYNESRMAVDFVLDKKLPEQPFIRLGRAVRYVEDFIFYL